MPRSLFSLVALLAFTSLAAAQLPPDKALASMKAGDGLQVELFAAEPMLINPTSIDVDHLGRVWVAEAVNYRRKNFNRPILREEGDRIVVLTDKDGDGKADESTVFYQGQELYGPLSVLVLPQANSKSLRVLVAQSPDILEFWDKDGDLKADGPPTKFLTGFGGFDHDHGVHGLTVGPDGKLYFTVGDSGVTGLQSKDGKGPKFVSNTTTIQKGTVWRCDLDGNHVELIAHNFRNNYEACVDSFGEIWLSDNDDDGNQQTRICFVMPGGNYGYGPRGPGQTHWHEEQPGIVHKAMRTGFGSPTGICFYEGTLLPKQYQGDLIHADAGPREIRYFQRKPKGAGYELDKIDMLTSTDNWFRPSDVCVAPDGSVFVSDWYDPGVGGHGMGDWTRGRIYRLTPTGHKGYKVPEVKLETDVELWTTLSNPNCATRTCAYPKASSMTREAFAALTGNELVRKAEDKIEVYATHIAILSRFVQIRDDKDDKEAMVAQLRVESVSHEKKEYDSPSSLVERDYRRMMTLRNMKYDHPNWSASLKESWPILKDKLPNVTSSFASTILLSLRFVSDTELMALYFYPLAKLYDGQDHFYRAALNIACGTDTERRDKILADFEKHFPEWNDKVADLVWELRPKSMLPKMERLMTDAKLTAAQKARIVDILAVNDDPAAGKTMLGLLKGDQSAEVKARAVENLRLFLPTKWNGIAKSDELKAAVNGLLKDSKNVSVGLQLVAASGYSGAIDAIGELIGNSEIPEPVRIEAVRTLGKLNHRKVIELLDAGIVFGKPEAIQHESIRSMAAQITGRGDSENAKAALASLQTLVTKSGVALELRRIAVDGLAGTRAGTGWLLKLQEDQKFPAELAASTGRLLRNSPFAGERNKAMILFPAPGKLDPKKLPPISELVKRAGSADNGRAILLKSINSEVQCLKCHMVRGQGGQIGPDLSMIGKKASKENLYDSLLTPSKAIADQYLSWTLTGEDGQSITGLVVGETETTITVRDANGKDYAFPAKGTERKKSLTSIMPDGLVATLTEDELVDVVEYLTKLQTPSLTPDSWMVIGPFASPNGNAGLDTQYGPEKGFDASAKFDGKSWTTVRPGANGYVDLAALHGTKANNSVSFAYRAIESPEEVEATILLGTDDGAILTVNGKPVLRDENTRAAAPGQNTVKLKLNKGTNTFHLKIANGNNPHGFYFTIEGIPEVMKK
ncbi:MAG: c-type cytochrome [Planctomycetia bacterium]|nr:c-type cytochrome [Planctomycetia bacterium]